MNNASRWIVGKNVFGVYAAHEVNGRATDKMLIVNEVRLCDDVRRALGFRTRVPLAELYLTRAEAVKAKVAALEAQRADHLRRADILAGEIAAVWVL